MNSPEDTAAMSRILNKMYGRSDDTIHKSIAKQQANSNYVELPGPGVTTQADVDAMGSILKNLNSVLIESEDTSTVSVVDSPTSLHLYEAVETERTPNGVKVGRYQIMIKEDQKRLAGKQFYSIYHSATNDTIADDISLYETALTVVRLLNSGKFANCPEIRKLFEHDDAYTSHKVDAIMYKRKMSSASDQSKKEIFESRYQASADRCMAAKKVIKTLANGR